MTSRELISALCDAGLPSERVRGVVNRLVRHGVLDRDKVEPEPAIVALLCAMSFRPLAEIDGISWSLVQPGNAEAVALVELISRGLATPHAAVWLVDNWRNLERVHCDIVPPVGHRALQMRRVSGSAVVELGKRGGWWGASPSPEPGAVLPRPASDRGSRSR